MFSVHDSQLWVYSLQYLIRTINPLRFGRIDSLAVLTAHFVPYLPYLSILPKG